MKVKMILAAVAAMCTTLATAQENRFSAGLELGLPMGDFGKAAGIGFGASLGFEMPVSQNLGIVAQLGYLNFSGKDMTVAGMKVEGSSQGVIPIQVGAKYYVSDGQEGFYVGLLTGVHMAMVKVPEITVDPVTFAVTTEEKTQTNTNFSLAPLVGFMVTENIDVSLRYQMIFASTEVVNPVTMAVTKDSSMNSYLGVRIAYMFGER